MGLNIYDRTFGFEFEVADVEKSIPSNHLGLHLAMLTGIIPACDNFLKLPKYDV